MEMPVEKKRLRRYSDDEIRQLVRETYISYAYAYGGTTSQVEAEQRWERLSPQHKASLEEVTVGVYRRIWFADSKPITDPTKLLE
jgi:hypothetical protein